MFSKAFPTSATGTQKIRWTTGAAALVVLACASSAGMAEPVKLAGQTSTSTDVGILRAAAARAEARRARTQKVRALRGKYKGKFSSVAEFMADRKSEQD